MRFSLFCFLILAMLTPAFGERQTERFETRQGPVEIIPIRHASVVLRAGPRTIYIDPFCEGDFANLPLADLVLITDIHGDHMDPDCLQKVKSATADVFGPPAVKAKLGFVQEIRNGETRKWGNWTVEAVPMYNMKRGPAEGKFFHEKGRGNGYVLSYGGKRLYFSGDTEGTPEMRALKNIDAAFVCMNLPYTMTPEEAADAVKEMHPKVAYPYHFRNGDKTMADVKKFEQALAGTGIKVKILDWYGK
jgi:L-ascorbate metabolism protein UlaG (beta-lactamase superfamily)